MYDFQTTITATAHCCAAKRISLRTQPVPANLRARLTRLIMAQNSDDLEPGDDGRPAIDFFGLKLGGIPAVLASAGTGGYNLPFWLFSHTPKGAWRTALSDDAGYLRPIESAGGTSHGLAVLRTQQHASCCEHVVTYYAYDGHAYQSLLSCTQLYDQDETPVLLWDGPKGAMKSTTSANFGPAYPRDGATDDGQDTQKPTGPPTTRIDGRRFRYRTASYWIYGQTRQPHLLGPTAPPTAARGFYTFIQKNQPVAAHANWATPPAAH
jgi:hypothetical protein